MATRVATRRLTRSSEGTASAARKALEQIREKRAATESPLSPLKRLRKTATIIDVTSDVEDSSIQEVVPPAVTTVCESSDEEQEDADDGFVVPDDYVEHEEEEEEQPQQQEAASHSESQSASKSSEDHAGLLQEQRFRDGDLAMTQLLAKHRRGEAPTGDPRERTYTMIQAIVTHLKAPWKQFRCDRAIWLEHWMHGSLQETGALQKEINVRHLAQTHFIMEVKDIPPGSTVTAPHCQVCNRRSNRAISLLDFSCEYEAKFFAGEYPPVNLFATLHQLRIGHRQPRSYPKDVYAASDCMPRVRDQLHWNYHFNARVLLCTADQMDIRGVPQTTEEEDAFIHHVLQHIEYERSDNVPIHTEDDVY